MKRITVSWLGLVAIIVGAFLAGDIIGPQLPRYRIVRMDSEGAGGARQPVRESDLSGQPVPESDLPDNLKTPVAAGPDIGDMPYPAPPCKSGAKICNPWERDWKPGATLPAGAVVDLDGTVWPKGKRQ